MDRRIFLAFGLNAPWGQTVWGHYSKYLYFAFVVFSENAESLKSVLECQNIFGVCPPFCFNDSMHSSWHGLYKWVLRVTLSQHDFTFVPQSFLWFKERLTNDEEIWWRVVHDSHRSSGSLRCVQAHYPAISWITVCYTSYDVYLLIAIDHWPFACLISAVLSVYFNLILYFFSVAFLDNHMLLF